MTSEKLDLIPVTEWGFFTLPRPMVIAGPCAAESEAQVMETARGLAAFGIHVFRAGIRKLGVIHRGFSTLQKTPYRNDPGWHVAVELRTRYPELPFFADPSHMGGDRKYLLELSQRAMDLGLEGLMIESHCQPEAALSDARQQLTPEALRILLGEQLTVRDADTQAADYRENIGPLRARIDVIDENILSLLKARMSVSREIGHYKRDHNIAILQTARWDELMEGLLRKGDAEGLDGNFLQALFNVIHQESIRIQNDVLSGGKEPTE